LTNNSMKAVHDFRTLNDNGETY